MASGKKQIKGYHQACGSEEVMKVNTLADFALNQLLRAI